MDSEKRQLETRIHEFKARVSNLQQELDNSVAVQNDFVRLSQSLQMELEKIRSQATEVTLINTTQKPSEYRTPKTQTFYFSDTFCPVFKWSVHVNKQTIWISAILDHKTDIYAKH